MEERKILTPQSVQQDLDALGQYKTADVDRLIRRYVKEQADAPAGASPSCCCANLLSPACALSPWSRGASSRPRGRAR